MWNQSPPHSLGRKCGLVAIPILLLGALFPCAVSAQSPAGSNVYGGLIIANRSQTRVLREAQKLIADGKYSDALVYLQRLLELDQDFLIPPKPDEAGGAFVSLRSQVHRIVKNLPQEGREIYLRNNGPVANVLLKQAIEQNDAEKLAEVARLYYHTPAGYEASYRIGLRHFDHGEPMTAALIFGRLQKSKTAARRWEPMLSLRIALSWLRAGMPNEAADVFTSIKKSNQEGRMVLAGQPRPLLGKSGKPAAWLSNLIQNRAASQIAQHSDWLIPRGTPTRNAVVSVPKPESSEPWQLNTVFYSDYEDPALDRDLQAAVPRQKTQRAKGSQHMLPSRSPLVVRGWVVSRTMTYLQSHDLEQGVLFGEYFSCDKALDRFTGADGYPPIPTADVLLGQWLDHRLWDDRTNGQISSDGRRLFSVEETGFWRGLPKQENRNALPVTNATVLQAFDLATSEMLWDAGGVPFNPDDDFDPRPLEGRFFLGPPLPMAGHLFCLVDFNNEIQLNVLNAASGDLEWSQPLASSPPLSITQDRARRTSGVSVAYADGILVCPTDAGAVVALDLTTRSLLWGFPTQQGGEKFPLNRAPVIRRQRTKPTPVPATLPNGWIDTTPTISDGHVVLTPLKSSRIFLLDLQTGERVWDHPRGQGLYVAGVREEKVIVVGEKNVAAWRTDNDESAWDRWLSLSEKPTGRGVIVGSKLLLPAGSELLVVDLKTGKEFKPIPAPADVRELGNLVVSRGRLISQTVDTVNVFPFPQLEE